MLLTSFDLFDCTEGSDSTGTKTSVRVAFPSNVRDENLSVAQVLVEHENNKAHDQTKTRTSTETAVVFNPVTFRGEPRMLTILTNTL